MSCHNWAQRIGLFAIFAILPFGCSTLGSSNNFADKARAYDAFIAQQLSTDDIFIEGGFAAMPTAFQFLDDQLSSLDKVVGLQDGPLLGGIYLASQALRFASTSDPEARKNVISMLNGLRVMSFVSPQGKGYFVRGVLRKTSSALRSFGGSCDEASACAEATYMGNAVIYPTKKASRDQYSGVLYGFAETRDMVTDPAVLDELRIQTKVIITYLMKNNFTLPAPPPQKASTGQTLTAGQKLAWLALAAQLLPEDEQFVTFFNEHKNELLDLLKLSVLTPVLGSHYYRDYYSYNLSYIVLKSLHSSLVALQDPLADEVKSMANKIQPYVKDTQNSFFDNIFLAQNGKAGHEDIIKDSLSGLNGYASPPNYLRAIVPPKAKIDDASIILAGLGQSRIQAFNPYPVEMRQDYFIWQRTPYRVCYGEFDARPFFWDENTKVKVAGLDNNSKAAGCIPDTHSASIEDKRQIFPSVDYLIAYWQGVQIGLYN